MAISDVLYRFLPESAFIKLRNVYQSFNKKVYPPMGEEEFRWLLTDKLNLKKGDTVFIHSSMDKLNIDFPVLRVLPILREVVGNEGTLAFPCWHFSYRAEEYLRETNSLFDVKKSPTVMGLLPELARKVKGARRSLHPFNSVVAIGKYADYLTREHHKSIYPSGRQSPFFRLTEVNGKLVGLGERTVSLSFVHTVEDVMQENFPRQTLTADVFEGKVKDWDRTEHWIKTKAPSVYIQNRNIPAYIKNHIPSNICSEMKHKGTNFFIAEAKPLLETMQSLAEKGITIYYQ
ncbi:MAG: AAC(3) family N-acetyltransferase [Bacteroidales bacterium]|nr:AAC(3) family N-acetyltransferase [Bacteroidales bacterium]